MWIVESPTLLGIVGHRRPGPSFGSLQRCGPETDRYSRAVRAAIKTAFDAAMAADPANDFRPPAAPAGEPA